MTAEQEAKARAALEQKMAELSQSTAAPVAPTPVPPPVAAPVPTPPVVTAPAPTPPPVAVTPAPTPPIAAPTPAAPPPVPASTKAGLERLAELNELYLANQITPAQYHHERAKIVESLKK